MTATASDRLRTWARVTGRDPATLTATYDGERIVTINGDAALAADAMRIAAATVQADVDAAESATVALAKSEADAKAASWATAKAGIDGRIEDRVANIERVLGLRSVLAAK